MKKLLKYIFIALLCSILFIMAINIDKIKFTYELLMSYKNLKNIEEKENQPIDLPTPDEIEVVQNPIDKLPIDIEKEEKENEEEPEEPNDLEENKEENKNEQQDNIDSSLNTPKDTSDPKDSMPKNSSNDNTNTDMDEINNNDKKDTDESDDQIYYNIVDKYYNILTEMQGEYEAKINSLIEEGYEEYKSGDSSLLELASKYLSIGTDLEKESDKKVESILNEMEEELVSNNLDTSILSEIQEYYEYLKDLRRSQLMSKAKEYMD